MGWFELCFTCTDAKSGHLESSQLKGFRRKQGRSNLQNFLKQAKNNYKKDGSIFKMLA